MNLNFNQQDIVRWSVFSGDYNSLHYSNERAGNPVQGMMAFISIMDRIIDANNLAGKEIIVMEALFRQHVYTDEIYSLSYKPVTKKLCLSDRNGKNVITGNFYCSDEISSDGQSRVKKISETIMVTHHEVKKRYQNFFRCFPDIKDYRFFIAALVFSKLMHSRAFLDLQEHHFTALHDYLTKTTTLQIDQSLTFFNGYSECNNEKISSGDIAVTIFECQSFNDPGIKKIRVFYYECHSNGMLLLQAKTTVISFLK